MIFLTTSIFFCISNDENAIPENKGSKYGNKVPKNVSVGVGNITTVNKLPSNKKFKFGDLYPKSLLTFRYITVATLKNTTVYTLTPNYIYYNI